VPAAAPAQALGRRATRAGPRRWLRARAVASRRQIRYAFATMFRPADYWFDLPPAQIAQSPSAQRDASRLLVVAPAAAAGARGDAVALRDRWFAELADHLPADAVVVVNDTKVIPARVHGVRPTGGAVELLFLEPTGERAAAGEVWRCLAKASGPLRVGQVVTCSGVTVTIAQERGPDGALACAVPGDALAFLDAQGELPLPHYIDRAADPVDSERYQTMFAREPGAVAAPTAGLHMTPAVTAKLAARGIEIAALTLHVGWGTFAPIRVDDVRQHRMHEERYVIPPQTAALVASGRPVVALGTTALRALEAAALGPRQVAAGAGRTALFVYPGSGHRFAVVDHLITNFHLPESTLLMLVCAFAGTDTVMRAYRHAVAAGYRFFSYGDAMLLARAP
jgi:S-adenosylmethionine:tRNA ribosyltransferase-isomerase